MPLDVCPPQLYKILSVENWKKSESHQNVVLDISDDEFIHFSTKDQLSKIVAKYWNHVNRYILLEVDPHKLKGDLVFETNPGRENKYWHLYNGSIPMESVLYPSEKYVEKSNMKMKTFNVIGLAVRTTNENGQMGKDIPQLWQDFMAGRYVEKVPNIIDPAIYSVYTEYEGDHTKPYTVILGFKVDNLDHVPKGMKGVCIEGGDFKKFTAIGDPQKGSVYNEWVKIWSTDMDRKYSADYEVYGEKAQSPSSPEVDIFIGLN
ncbi:MAG: DUF952 domain-containing protein [Rhabdochlamydiaceae bacterium]|nr:DUF952 domain-containing protein [Candidatus Amphrikana amoebophyrae]